MHFLEWGDGASRALLKALVSPQVVSQVDGVLGSWLGGSTEGGATSRHPDQHLPFMPALATSLPHSTPQNVNSYCPMRRVI